MLAYAPIDDVEKTRPRIDGPLDFFEEFHMRTRKSMARTFLACSLLGIFSCACSATSSNDDHIATEVDKHGKATALDSDTGSDSCEGESRACKQMQIATMKMRKLERA